MHAAGSPIATLLHVAQKEEFAGDRSMARERCASEPTLALQPEIGGIAWGSEGKDARHLNKPR